MASTIVGRYNPMPQQYLNPDALKDYFHELFHVQYPQIRKKIDKKISKKKNKGKSSLDKRRPKIDSSNEVFIPQPPFIELAGNPSVFAVFANVRQAVLEKQMKDITHIYMISNSNRQSDSESEDDDETPKENGIKVAKVVGIGLCGMFELIRESRSTQPELCTRALQALLDVLQGQQPEGLKLEPLDVLAALFELLMDLATGPASEVSSADSSNSLTALACACLLSLVVAQGDTGKILTATSALLMCPQSLASQSIKMPVILTHLQRSVQAVLLGKTIRPEWLTHGVPAKSLMETFSVNDLGAENLGKLHSAIVSDGWYLYIYNARGLYKVGSGYSSTIKGHVYSHRLDFRMRESGWLAFAYGQLFFKPHSPNTPMTIIDVETLKEKENCDIEAKDWGPHVMFGDGENLGHIAASRDDSFVVRTFNFNGGSLILMNELMLKLACRCVDVFGTAAYDDLVDIHTINTGFDDETATIAGGKEFSLIRTVSGKIFYTGKSQSLGIKQGGPLTGKWAELPITKSPKIVQFSLGHEGLHALLVAEDGSVFFVGHGRRGEDGDASKARRQPKPVKPKKMIKLEGHNIMYSACNNGTSALITKEGEVYMFGKDAAHCDRTTGQVTDLKDVVVIQIALGKAHVIALTNRGHVYTFGMNNKGQCGREMSSQVKETSNLAVAMSTTNEEDGEDEELEIDESDVTCPPGKHLWKTDQCMVCTVCGECTGYGPGCISNGRPDRNPGLPCGCGSGDSGCSDCGCCRTCAGEPLDKEPEQGRGLFEVLAKSRDLFRLDLIIGGRQGAGLQDQLQRKFDERRQRQRRQSLKINKAKMDETKIISCVEESDYEKDQNKIALLPPTRILIGNGDVAAVQVACGLHHTVVLLQNGQVYTFGSGQHGQLGLYDLLGDLALSNRGTPTWVPLRIPALQIAAGSNHTVILTANGQVYTCGSYQKGQLGRPSPTEDEKKDHESAFWFAIPGIVPGIGAKQGRRATWIGASGDQTYLKIDESLISAHSLPKASIIASKSCIGLIPGAEDGPSSFKCLMINKLDGSCKSFNSLDQVDFGQRSVCLDPVFNILWSYDASQQKISCYNVIAAETRKLYVDEGSVPDILSPELALPSNPLNCTTRAQSALHMLGCLDTLTLAQECGLTVFEEDKEKQSVNKIYTKDDFTAVNRFESHGGGWGYSGHSVEAIRFMADTDILLGGVGLFGGRGEYTGKLKLFDISMDGGDQESDGDLIAETEEISYECRPREKYAMLFDEPVLLQANRWYVVWAHISGPSSDCGSSGLNTVTTEDLVVFHFKSSKKSNNGTDVNAGQIPQLFYKVITHENSGSNRRSDQSELVYVLNKDFSRTIKPDCFDSLLKLFSWSWDMFKLAVREAQQMRGVTLTAAIVDLERLVYVSTASLRLIRTYTSEVYPSGALTRKNPPETTRLAECVVETRLLLCKILSDHLPTIVIRRDSLSANKKEAKRYEQMMDTILTECHHTFVSCFHAFYPTSLLKWNCLCNLLSRLEPHGPDLEGVDRLLAAVLAALCSPAYRLTSILPISWEQDTEQTKILFGEMDSSFFGNGENVRFPLLMAHMKHRFQENNKGSLLSFVEVLDQLLSIVVLPVRQALNLEKMSYSIKLVSNTCALLSSLVAELSAATSGTEIEVQSAGRVLQITPSRFSRVSQSRTWNTGNGSPDAVCFTVDKPGIMIAGVCIYGGSGTYDYELELLDDSESSNDPSHTQRWNSLEIVRGTFGSEDCTNDIAEIKFDRPVPIKEGVKYAIRLRNHGGRTSNGDGGIPTVKCSDGTTFTFSACSLSFNGTNHTRGQVPQILYYSSPQDTENQQSSKGMAEIQAKRVALNILSCIVRAASDLLIRAQAYTDENLAEILGSAPIFSSLLPMVLAYFSATDPKSAVQILELIQELLPLVAKLNNRFVIEAAANNGLPVCGPIEQAICTTSHHYAVVESDHPYKPATVSNYKVTFPPSVRWMALEFNLRCGTAQIEDVLQLYIPSHYNSKHVTVPEIETTEGLSPKPPLWPVLKRFYGSQSWPQAALILPGNEVMFSLETASDYVKDDRSCFFGFKCLVIGYEWSSKSEDGLKHLEKELAYLGGNSAASLMKKDLALPPVTAEEIEEDLEYVNDVAQEVYSHHSSLLGKGFVLSHPCTIHQTLDGILPFGCQSNERSFLKDFVACTSGTSGGRLARWLQPDSYVDYKQCDIMYNKEDLKCGWPTIITVFTKDQYGEIVHVPNLKVEVKAVPIDKKDSNRDDNNKKLKQISKPEDGPLTYGGHSAPGLEYPYEVTVKDKMSYSAITLMKMYENYSFEELRYATPTIKRPSENMLVRTNNDGTYSANWTPASVSWYSIHVAIDGFETDEIYKVEVKKPPAGITPPIQNNSKKNSHQPNKIRKFLSKYSAGLRIRAHPSLQSEQIGLVEVNGTISFIDELHNDDGLWLRLSSHTIRKYCNNDHGEAWCLQYNQHIGRTLLVPIEEPKSVLDDFIKDSVLRDLPEFVKENKHHKGMLGGPGTYQVVKCGSSGHNVRSRPSLKAPPVGMLVFGNQVNITEDINNSDGTWVKLDKDSMRNYCFNIEGEAWSLACGKNDMIYLKHEAQINAEADEEGTPMDQGLFGSKSNMKGFDFGSAQHSLFLFTPQNSGMSLFDFMGNDQDSLSESSGQASPFVFGSPVTTPFGSTKIDEAVKVEDKRELMNSKSSIFQRWIKEEEFQPERKYSSNLIDVPELAGVSVKELVKAIGESRFNGNGVTPPRTPPGTPKRGSSRSSSPVPIGSPRKPSLVESGNSSPVYGSPRGTPGSPRRNSMQSEDGMNILGGPAKRSSLNHSPSNSLQRTSVTPSSGKSVAQTGTQTSPEGVKGHFSIGSGSAKEGNIRLSPKMTRKDRPSRQLRPKRERAHSPAPRDKVTAKGLLKQEVKEALSPSVAECIRAVFAAFLWHEGIVHDAMACASFLKFHPNLPKQSRKLSGRDQKLKNRHSISTLQMLATPTVLEGSSKIINNININQNKTLGPEPIKEEEPGRDFNKDKDILIEPKIEDCPKEECVDRLSAGLIGISSVPVPFKPPPVITETIESELPSALQHLVALWEEMSLATSKVITQNLILPSPVLPMRQRKLDKKDKDKEKDKDKKLKKKKDPKPTLGGRGNLFGEAAGSPFGGLERETMCELCGNYFPHPVTYHMRQAHPGCGCPAGGKGYNSGGSFCGGWAGNCGDGGIGGSNWYLICDLCREKCIQKRLANKEKARKLKKKSLSLKQLPNLPQQEPHQIMKNNALFLLDLVSAAGTGLPTQACTPTRRNLPSVSEHATDQNPFPHVPFQSLLSLGIPTSALNELDDDYLLDETFRAVHCSDVIVIPETNGPVLLRSSSFSKEDRGIVSYISPPQISPQDIIESGQVLLTRSTGSRSDSEAMRRAFHRSISEGVPDTEWQAPDGAVATGKVIITRRRNNSCVNGSDGGSSLLRHPSAALTKLVSGEKIAGPDRALQRPVMSFIIQRHDLEGLQLATRQALRKAACRTYAMQALNWLLRNVSQPTCLHDIFWHFVSSLTLPPSDFEDDDILDDRKEKRDQDPDKDNPICEHPLCDIAIAGEAVNPLIFTFHTLLQTISDLMMLLPLGSSLQQMAMRCWCLKFRQSDHMFLHKSYVFSNISKILSGSEEGDGDETILALPDTTEVTSIAEVLKDITSSIEIKASSRQAMVSSLTDNSTETFWESGDEDRNKTKVLLISCPPNIRPRMVYIHIDNSRDLGNKVSHVIIKAGINIEETTKVKQVEVESRYTGWIGCPIMDSKHCVIKLEVKGPDNTLRLRQVKVLGEVRGESLLTGKQLSAAQMQQKNCETETLKVFRLLTSQVFGKLIHEDSLNEKKDESKKEETGELKPEGENDLKEHMVGILFSRSSKLTHLQKQVCAHIVQAIRKETCRVREEWEISLCSKSLSIEELPKASDAYCFELLSMVLALSGSVVGRMYLAQQHGLLQDMLSLLHTGTPRVQRQVTSLLRRVLPKVMPQTFAKILGVKSLPPADFSIVSEVSKIPKTQESFDLHNMGILDVFLSCIAKALTVQTKVKGNVSSKGVTTVTLATSIHPRDNVGARWWLRGCMTRKLAEVIITLMKDMAAGKLSEAWGNVTKSAIAENILNLTKLDEQYRTSQECLKTPTIWLFLASLCVLDQDHVERLSSGQWSGSNDGQTSQPRPTCDNHDDGETSAIIVCSICGNLCADCDRFLHLHRKTRTHHRQVFKEEEEAIKVDLHEGCGRTKLFWVMALADSKTLKAMIEFREGTRGKTNTAPSGICRFCGATGNIGLLAIGNVCGDPECQSHAKNACTKILNCGHLCGGIKGEEPCLPCLHGCASVDGATLKQDADDMCMICFTEALACAPAIQLICGHVFHLHCCQNVLKKRWVGPRITFGFSLCPICKSEMNHSLLKDLLSPIRTLYEDVRKKALMRLEYEGLHKAEAITTPGARFYNHPEEFAMERYAYYVCFKCKKAYYGGEARCDVEAGGGDDYDPAELVCGGCSDVSRAQMCPKHGTDFLEYKCRYCCSVAVFFCFGTTHFCNACHDDFQRVTNIPKTDLPHCPAGPKAKQLDGDECPLHVLHPPTGEEFALGCGVCRNAHTF